MAELRHAFHIAVRIPADVLVHERGGVGGHGPDSGISRGCGQPGQRNQATDRSLGKCSRNDP
jgi:hypothetical protein